MRASRRRPEEPMRPALRDGRTDRLSGPAPRLVSDRRTPGPALAQGRLEPPAPTMQPARAASAVPAWPAAAGALVVYAMNAWQRGVLLLDVLREAAEAMLAHEQAGLPPLLAFEYEVLLDARRFERPANYLLLRITRCDELDADARVEPGKPPVLILDPRAGHGPGIGGFKHASEVGNALHAGHPVYFVGFHPEPCAGQTLSDVLAALRRFVQTVSTRHGGAAPVLYGNCQAGWAAMLLAASCEGLAGPAVLAGSPLSYWAGATEVNPMRLTGGLTGGAWAAHWLADLGDGRFDGAWLVQNFENLQPARSLWSKYYTLYADPTGERERFLAFERWWSGFYFLSREEMLAIVQNLFIGNRLERGELRVDECCTLDLRRLRSPLVVFASRGDNITPPHQALAWIPALYEDTAALVQAGQRIVYLLHEHAGHLGIFVSAAVAQREHRAILAALPAIETLPPGLYEMVLDDRTPADPAGPHPLPAVRFEPREVEDLQVDYPRASFERVRQVSETLDAAYTAYLSPWVRAWANPVSAGALKWLHPMRMSRLLFSDKLNPWMRWVAPVAQAIAAQPLQVAPDQSWRRLEAQGAESVTAALEQFQQARDAWLETLFQQLYPSGTPTRHAGALVSTPSPS